MPRPRPVGVRPRHYVARGGAAILNVKGVRKPYRDPGTWLVIGLILIALYSIRHAFNSTTLLLFAVVVPAIILHELAHGMAALGFGDDTARRAGRITLNPIRHIDPLGTIVLPAILALAGYGVFGYAKPVPINPSRMRHPRNDALLVSLAGPATNLLLAGLSVVALHLLHPRGLAYLFFPSVGDHALFLFGFVNVTLAVFNALPIPPLDGSAVIARLLPPSALTHWYTLTRVAMPILLVLVLLDPGRFLLHVFGPAERAFARMVAS